MGCYLSKMKKSIKILLGCLGGLLSLTFLFIGTGLISFNNEIEKVVIPKNLTTLDLNDSNTTSDLKCVRLSDGRKACLIVSNVSINSDKIETIETSLD